MAKCLRCGAGNEWLEGDVKREPRKLPTEVRKQLDRIGSVWESICSWKGKGVNPHYAALHVEQRRLEKIVEKLP